MQALRVLVALAAPVAIALAALTSATGISALVEASLSTGMVLLPVIDVRARAGVSGGELTPPTKSADPILDRNPFDHVAGSLRPRFSTPEDPGPRNTDPASAPLCDGVRPVVVVGDEDQTVAFTALEYEGKRMLRRRGGTVGDAHVAYVGRDRVWLEGVGGLCQALLFGGAASTSTSPPPKTSALADPTPRSALELEVGKQIAKTGPNEYAIERSAVDRILEAQAELMKHRMVPEKENGRVVGVKVLGIKPGSVLGMLGMENGDRLETINGYEVADPEKMLEAYARLRAGADKLKVQLTRGGRKVEVEVAIR